VSLWNLRLRALLEEQFSVVATVLLVLALVGGFMTYTAYVDPGTTTEEQVVSTWETTGGFDHSATVVEENPVFPVGSDLRNRSVYFSRLAPVLNGTYVFGYRTTGTGELTADVTLALVTRSSAGNEAGADSGNGVLWETQRTVGETRATLGSGESVRVPFTLNATAVQDRRDRIARQLGTSTGTVETVVQATVAVRGTVNGEQVKDSRTHTLPLTFESSTYQVGAVQDPSQQTEITQPVTVPREYGPLWIVGGPALVVVGAGGLAGLTVVRSRRELGLTDAEKQWVAYREDRSEFEEWITSFSLPDEAFERPRAEAASLGDLVDFAIDTDNSVVELSNGSEYLVVEDEFLYTYTAPPVPQPEDDPRDKSEVSETKPEEAESESQRLDEAAQAYLGGHDGNEPGEERAEHDDGDETDWNEVDMGAADSEGSPADLGSDDLEPMIDRLDEAAFDLDVEPSDDEDGADSAADTD
jgi:hypothetical protein